MENVYAHRRESAYECGRGRCVMRIEEVKEGERQQEEGCGISAQLIAKCRCYITT
jgi:hypothetical protein